VSESSVPKADRVKSSENKDAPPRLEDAGSMGTQPNFKRKKSFWRALRRGEVWALVPMRMHSMINQLAVDLCGGHIPVENFLTDRYIPSDVMYLMRKNK